MGRYFFLSREKKIIEILKWFSVFVFLKKNLFKIIIINLNTFELFPK